MVSLVAKAFDCSETDAIIYICIFGVPMVALAAALL